jgi:threonine dehydrogenase-like Zn-dependent dehydrogenase
MHALRITSVGRSGLLDVATPEPGEGEVLLAPLVVGLCATDIELLDGTMVYLRDGSARLPLTPGHEWVARVVECGAGVGDVAAGDLVVGECSVGCAACPVCASGAYHRCPRRRETGIMNLDGALAGRMVFPARALHRVPAGVSVLDAALVEPLAVAFRAVQRAGITPDDTVLVVGAGTIGLLAVQVVRAVTGASVAVLEPNPHRAARAERAGATICGSGERYPRVLDASGSAAGFAAAHSRVASGGRLVLVGLTGQPEVPFALDEVVVRDQELVGSLGSPGVWPEVLETLSSTGLRPSDLVTDRFVLDDAEAAIALMRAPTPQTGKIVILPNGAVDGGGPPVRLDEESS